MKTDNANNKLEVFKMRKMKILLALLLGIVSMVILGACGPMQTTTTFIKPTTDNPIVTTTTEKPTTTQNTTNNETTDNNTTS